MTEPLLRTMPPSDLQIATVERICRERGFPMPPLHSSTEASQIISALVAREYHPSDAEWDRHEQTPADADAEWLARVRYENDG